MQTRSRQQRPAILVVDDDPSMVDLMAEALARHGFLAVGSTSVEDALSRLREQTFSAMIADLRMPSSADGERLCEQAAQHHPDLEIILLSGDRDIDEIAAQLGTHHLVKPAGPTEIVEYLARIGISVGDNR